MNIVERPVKSPTTAPERQRLDGLALLLIGIGVAVSLVPGLNLGLPAFLSWPFFVILPGAAVFTAGVVTGGKLGERLAQLGSMVSTVGAILLFQSITDLFSTWAYAWTLVVPTSLGVGRVLYGILRGRGDLISSGMRLVVLGAVLFGFGIAFFEGLIGLNGFGIGALLGTNWLPYVLVGVGLVLLVGNRLRQS